MPKIILIRNDYPDNHALLNVLNYAMRSQFYDGYALDPDRAYRQMMMVKNAYHKVDGVQLLHFIISFSDYEACILDMNEMLDVGWWAAQYFKGFQSVYALHSDTRHFHLHIVVNTVSFEDGHRYSDGDLTFWAMKKGLQERFRKSDVGVYRSYPRSNVNQYMDDEDRDAFLRIG